MEETLAVKGSGFVKVCWCGLDLGRSGQRNIDRKHAKWGWLVLLYINPIIIYHIVKGSFKLKHQLNQQFQNSIYLVKLGWCTGEIWIRLMSSTSYFLLFSYSPSSNISNGNLQGNGDLSLGFFLTFLCQSLRKQYFVRDMIGWGIFMQLALFRKWVWSLNCRM